MKNKFDQSAWNAMSVVVMIILSLWALIEGVLLIVSKIARGGV